MNNSCPSCGAVYNVTNRDIGRRIRCKKCSSPLIVTDAGLEMDEPGAGRVDAPEPVEDDAAEPAPKRSRDRDRGRRTSGGGPGLGDLLAKVGGIPTILFGIGVFLVIVFTFMPRIGDAAVRRAEAGESKLKLDMDREIKRATPKDKDGNPKPPGEWADADRNKIKEITDKYQKQIDDSRMDAAGERVSNDRAEWLERYGLMFGFLFVAFGCIGYLRTEQPLVLRIVAGVVLGFMLMIVFLMVAGCGESVRPPVPRGGKGG